MFTSKEEIKFAIILGTSLLSILLLLIVFAIILFKIRQNNHVKEKLHAANQYQKEILRTRLEIQEQTFKTISQEIHDNIGQVLSLAKLNLNTVDLAKETATDKISNAKDLVSKAIQDLRDISKTLNTEAIASTGLIKAIEHELQMLQKTGAVQTELVVEGAIIKLDPQKELILFRIVQEALNNIIKHAKSSVITVCATYSSNGLQLKVTDNGCGFTATKEQPGSGLRNMQSRAGLIGAVLLISSNSEGTCVTINLPII